jgi:formylglycine-generating enzyme required for sulfatase activity
MVQTQSDGKLKVFVSYARRDSSDFAEELVAGLELAGFAPFLDRHDIAAGEDWEARLGGLIREADTILFVVSPEAVNSDRCAWEVENAIAQSKRILPVVFKPVPEAAIPEPLRRRQFVRFDTGPGIARPLAQLAEALRQDIDWIREHTRLGELARRWEARGRSDSLLLRGDELSLAEGWSQRWHPGAPEITDLMRAFLAASLQSEAVYLAKSNAAQLRTIRMQRLILLLLVGFVVGAIGWINQAYVGEQWHWYWTVRPFAATNIWPYLLRPSAEAALKPKDTFRECRAEPSGDYCPEMVVVPAGSFVMGARPDEVGQDSSPQPQHAVTFARPFAVSKYQVTFDEWDACVAYGDCKPKDDNGWGRGSRPTIFVSWRDAKDYVGWLARMTGKPYRLPSEAEYEYAARAGSQTAYPWGEEIGKNNAVCDGCGSQWDNKETAPVGSFAPNRFGLYDAAGNVWEWVEDCLHADYHGAPNDGSAWTGGGMCGTRVQRGAGWGSPTELLRSFFRNWNAIDNSDKDFGFRIARTLAH